MFINIKDTAFSLVVPPKCGSTAIFSSVYNFENNTNLRMKDIKDRENVPFIHGKVGCVTYSKPTNPILIGIHRDPVERFISAFRHIILDRQEPCHYSNWGKCVVKCFDSFLDAMSYEVTNIPGSAITHHFEPQSAVFKNFSYDYILPLDKIQTLENIIDGFKIFTDINTANNNDQNNRPKFSPGSVVREKIKEFYRDDYKNGWDGVTYKEKEL